MDKKIKRHSVYFSERVKQLALTRKAALSPFILTTLIKTKTR